MVWNLGPKGFQFSSISGYLLKNSSGLDQSFKTHWKKKQKVSKNSQKKLLKKMAKNSLKKNHWKKSLEKKSLKKITEKKSLKKNHWKKITKKIQKNLECFQTVKEFDNYVFCYCCRVLRAPSLLRSKQTSRFAMTKWKQKTFLWDR